MSRRYAAFVACCTIFAVVLSGCGPRSVPATGQKVASPTLEVKSQQTATTEKTAEPRLMTREEFKKAVIGKKKDDVIKAVGIPDSTSEIGDESLWYYRNKVVDTITGKTDVLIQVSIDKNGRAVSVRF
jgi:outer membrane protein assembly factor BamE (lipoprotein component of BamABCDE complex)